MYMYMYLFVLYVQHAGEVVLSIWEFLSIILWVKTEAPQIQSCVVNIQRLGSNTSDTFHTRMCLSENMRVITPMYGNLLIISLCVCV